MEPPRLAERLLRRIVPAGIVGESMLGDAREEYADEVRALGRWRAGARYWCHVLRMALHYRHGDRHADTRDERSAAPSRPTSSSPRLLGVGEELRFTLRRLRRSPAFTGVTVLTLAIGIGSTTAMFSVVDCVLLDPLPFRHAESLVSVSLTLPGIGLDRMPQSRGTYFTFREHNRVFEDLALWRSILVTVTGAGEPERVEALAVTDGFLPVLRVEPLLGRPLTAEDDVPDKDTVLLLAYDYWQTRFGGDPQVVGRTLEINGLRREIVGVLPAGFRFLDTKPSLLAPLQLDRASATVGGFNYPAIARLRESVTLEEARRGLGRLIPLAIEEHPGDYTPERARQSGLSPLVQPLENEVIGNADRVLWLLLAAVGIVLLIAYANVANLVLVRAEGQRREIALRTALGAGGARLARELVGESLVLGLGAGAAGLGAAAWALHLLHVFAPTSVPRLDEIALDGTALLFDLTLSLLVSVSLGLVLVLRHRSLPAARSLQEGACNDGRGRHRTRSLLAISQVALALVLLVGSGLMIRSLRALWKVDPGFERPEEVLTLTISIPSAEIVRLDEVALAHQRIASAISSLSTVDSVGISTSAPMDGRWSTNMTHVQGRTDASPPSRRYKFVSPEYFSTLGIPLLAGRALAWSDIEQRLPVAIVNERFAREYWGDPREALGQHIAQDPEGGWREIVGVVGNVHDDGLDRAPRALVYWPLAVSHFWGSELLVPRTVAYVIRTHGLPASAVLEQVRSAVRSVDAKLPVADVRSLRELVARSTARTAFVMSLLSCAAGLALLLGVVGLYAVLSFVVSTRTRELGLRIAVGARRVDITTMVLGRGLTLAAAGIGLGLAASFGLTRLFAASLYGVEPADPLSYIASATVLTAVALLASYLPACRASSVDPLRALRHE